MGRLISASLLVGLVVGSLCSAATITVNADGSGDYLTIQAAIDDANDGDVIIVADGVYTGPGNRDIDFLGKAITVRSENGPCGCIIDCQQSGRGFYFHSAEGPNSVLEGLTIENGLSNYGGGICCYSSPTIQNCIIRGNSAGRRGGGMYHRECSAKLSNCIFSGNSADRGGGLFHYNILQRNPTLTNCVFYNNSAQSDGGGICIGLSVLKPKLTNCILYANVDSDGMDESAQIHSGMPLVNYCCIQGWTGGFGGVGNIGADPCFVDPCSGDYHLLPNSPCIDSGDPEFVPQQGEVDIDGEPRVMGNRVDMGADEFDFFEMSFIIISHSAFEFRANKGGPNPEEQILSIRNSGMRTLNWEIIEDCNWLAVEPNTGSCPSGEANDVILSVDVTGLEKGTYYCNFAIVDPCAWNDPQTVTVTLYVSVPFIELSSNEFEFFSSAIGGPNPDPQVLTIRNGGGRTLNWEITYDCNWLTVNPVSGSSTGEPNEVTLSVDITGLAIGEYDCNLTISDPNASNSPQIAQVELFICCFPSTPEYAQQYADYLLYKQYNNNQLRVDCWCAPPFGSGYQCDGDADGFIYGFGKYRVFGPDFTLLVNNWRKKIDDPTLDPCADFDHKPYGWNKYRVFSPDFTILVNNWKKYDVDNFTRPVEERLPGDCPRPE